MKRALAFAAGLIVLLAAWFGRASFGGGFLLDASVGQDIYHLSTLYERVAHHVANGNYPLWMPEFQGGYPAAAAWMYGLFYPPLLLFAAVSPELAWTWLSILHIAFGGVGVYLYVLRRRWDPAAAMTGGILFALSEFMVGRVLCGHLNLVMSVAWAPWVLLQLARCADGRPGARGWLGLCFGAALLAGHVQMWFYLGPLVAAYAVGLGLRSSRRRQVFEACLGGLALGVAVAAIQWVPTMELYLLPGAVRAPPDVEGFSLPGQVLAAKAWPGFFGWRPGDYWGGELFDHEFLGIGGLASVLLASLSLARWNEPGRLFWLVAALAGVILALADNTPLGHFLQHVPLISSGRTPSRAILLTVLAVSVLAAHGVADWNTYTGSRKRMAWVAGGVTGALAIASGLVLRSWLAGPGAAASEAAGNVGTSAVVATLLAVVAVCGALYVSTRSRKLELAVPAAAVVAALLGALPPAQTVSSRFYHRDWLAELPPEAREHRVLLIDQRLPNIERAGGRTQRELCYVDAPAYEALMARINAAKSPTPDLAWLDVGLVVNRPRPQGDAAGDARFAGPWAPLEVARTPAVGRARLFGSARAGVANEEAFAVLETGASALMIAGPVADAPPRDAAADAAADAAVNAAGQVEILPGTDPNRLAARFSSPVPAWLFLSEKHYPGWVATIDGAPAAIHRANVAFRAVRVPAGEHELELHYEPHSVRIGLAITLSALAGLLLAFVRGLRTRRKGADDADLDLIR